MSQVIFLINGPNLNLLGKREPAIYGADTLEQIEERCSDAALAHGFELECFQSNHEGEIIDQIHRAREEAAGIIINPGAYTHSSIAILDALNAFEGLVVEIHISQVHKREAFRQRSYVAKRADAVMAGFGVTGYEMALSYMIEVLG